MPLYESFWRMVPGTVPMPDAPLGYVHPTSVWFWRLTFDQQGDTLMMFYEKAAEHLLPDDKYETFKGLLKEYLTGTFTPNWTDVEENEDPGPTPLSISFDGFAYMVIVLTDKQWRYSTAGEPFTVQSGKEDFYLHARSVWMDGNSLTTGKVAPSEIDCTTAFFIADAHGDQEKHGPESRTAFNIYPELILPGATGRRFLPIVIDPDVGYPEGTKT